MVLSRAVSAVPGGQVVPSADAPASTAGTRVLLADDLRKSYGSRVALRGLSFSLKAGRILGFLGPNGAGKTTAIRILTTILEPSAGHFFVGGISGDEPARIRRLIGVLPESLGFPKHSTALDYLSYYGRLYGRTAADATRRGLALLEEVGLRSRAASLIGSYSRGMRQRLGIARALINDPIVVFLDEPTLGLDPRGQQELLGIVQRIARERDAGVVLCSHLLWEIEKVCDDVVILNSGHIVATGTVREVIERAHHDGTRRSVARIRVPPPFLDQARKVLEATPTVRGVTPTGEVDGWLLVDLRDQGGDGGPDTPPDRNQLLEALIQAKVPVLGFDAVGGRLQDVFLHLTEGSAA